MLITPEALAQHRAHGSWRELEALAQELCGEARTHGGESFNPVLGGGTRLMLALNHRISDDIDLFVDSPGWLPYLSPRLNDDLEARVDSYHEDASHVKLRLPQGEIDFIASGYLLAPMVDLATLWNPPAAETSFPLEPPAEILAKKLFLRGWALTARDLFDWAYLDAHAPAGALPKEALAILLRAKLPGLSQALAAMPDNPTSQTRWEAIRAAGTPGAAMPKLADTVLWAQDQVQHLTAMAEDRSIHLTLTDKSTPSATTGRAVRPKPRG